MPNCDDCIESFNQLDLQDSRNRSSFIDEQKPFCCCERCSVSSHSPGPIALDEILIRVLVAPQHMKGDGTPKVAALTDAERGGLSVFREATATDDDIRKVAEQLTHRAKEKGGGKAGVFGVLRMQCSAVKEVRGSGEEAPAYCVYDTALPDIRSHGEIFQRVNATDIGVIEERRRRLFNAVLVGFVRVNEFRNGLLADLAPQTLR